MLNSCILVCTIASCPFLYMFGLLATTILSKLKVSTIATSSVYFATISILIMLFYQNWKLLSITVARLREQTYTLLKSELRR